MLVNCPRCLEPVENALGLPAPCPECMAEIKFRLAVWKTRPERNVIWKTREVDGT